MPVHGPFIWIGLEPSPISESADLVERKANKATNPSNALQLTFSLGDYSIKFFPNRKTLTILVYTSILKKK